MIDYQLLGLAVILLLKPLLELGSGSNDPMAALLTIGLVQVLTQPNLSPAALVLFSNLPVEHASSRKGTGPGHCR